MFLDQRIGALVKLAGCCVLVCESTLIITAVSDHASRRTCVICQQLVSGVNSHDRCLFLSVSRRLFLSPRPIAQDAYQQRALLRLWWVLSFLPMSGRSTDTSERLISLCSDCIQQSVPWTSHRPRRDIRDNTNVRHTHFVQVYPHGHVDLFSTSQWPDACLTISLITGVTASDDLTSGLGNSVSPRGPHGTWDCGGGPHRWAELRSAL